MAKGTRRAPSKYNWSKQLFDEMLLPTTGAGRRATTPRRGKVKHIDIHHMTVKDSTNGAANRTCVNIWETRKASAHYGIDRKYVAQFVYDNAEAWGNANTKANQEGIVIEHANSTLGPKWEIHDETIASSVRLVAELHVTHKLGRPTSTGFGTGGTIRTHQSFYATSCPGPYFKKIWKAYVKQVQAKYDEITGAKPAPKPKPKPKPTPKPQPRGLVVTSSSLNAGSYNATGARTYRGRIDNLAVRRLASELDILNLQEVGNGINRKSKPNCRMRSYIDTKMGKVYRRHIGSGGRYCYSNRTRVKPIKSGAIITAKKSWYRKDDKQASYVVYEKDGVRAMDVSFHLENEEGSVADAKRVEQMLSTESKAVKIAGAQGVDVRNILFTGDTNSEGMVAKAMLEAGWRNVGTGTEYLNSATYIGWDGKAEKRFDYGFVHETAAPAVLHQVHASTGISDHAELVIKRQLTRP